MKLLGRKKTASSPRASKGKSFRRSVTPKKMRNDDGEGETTKPRSRSRSLSKRFSMRSSRKSKQKTSPPVRISPVAVDQVSSQKSAARATPPPEATKEEATGAPTLVVDDAAEEEAEEETEEETAEETAPAEDEVTEEEATPLKEEEDAASSNEEEEADPAEGDDEVASEEEDAASAKEEDAASAKEEETADAPEAQEEEAAPTAASTEEATPEEEEAPERKAGAVAKEETETADEYSYDEDLSMEPSVEMVAQDRPSPPQQPRGEKSAFDVGMRNVKLIVDGAMAQAMNLGAQGSELLGCCADTTTEDYGENNPASDLVAAEEDSKTRGAAAPANPNQSIFLQPKLLDKAKDLWEQARNKGGETYTEAYSTLENKAANQGASVPVGCITEETEETDDTGEESEDPSPW